MPGEVVFIDMSDEVLDELEDACLRALVRCGNQAEGYALDLVPVDTGDLKESISNKVVESEKAVYIGTDSDHGIYVELGTGKFASTGGGTPKEHWVYRGDDGEFHVGKPQPPQPFLKPAVANHVQTYKNIIKDELKG